MTRLKENLGDDKLKAFSPGSITLFFSIRDMGKEINRMGSIGLGIVIDRGAITRTEISSTVEVSINGIQKSNTIQENILKKTGIKAKVETFTQMPISQGFGMSAAAAVSTSFSLLYGERTYYECISIAHQAEIEMGSGLGDVSSISAGGFNLRMRAGIPPYGFIDRFNVKNDEFIVFWLDEPIETKGIIRDVNYRKKIIKAGNRAFKNFLAEKSLKNAFRVARSFSKEISISSSELKEIMEKALNYGEVAQIMIGNSLIAYGNNDSLEKLFEKYGNVARVRIYESLPKIIKENI